MLERRVHTACHPSLAATVTQSFRRMFRASVAIAVHRKKLSLDSSTDCSMLDRNYRDTFIHSKMNLQGGWPVTGEPGCWSSAHTRSELKIRAHVSVYSVILRRRGWQNLQPLRGCRDHNSCSVLYSTVPARGAESWQGMRQGRGVGKILTVGSRPHSDLQISCGNCVVADHEPLPDFIAVRGGYACQTR